MPRVKLKEVATNLKGLKANQNFSGATEKVDKGGPNSVDVKSLKVAKKCNVSHRAISRVVNEDLRMKSYMRRCCNLLNATQELLKKEYLDDQWWIFKFRGPRQGFPKIDVL